MLIAMNKISLVWEITLFKTLEFNLRVRQRTQYFKTKDAIWLLENDRTSHA